jgi:transcriptional regulator with XRE-family HTH domain
MDPPPTIISMDPVEVGRLVRAARIEKQLEVSEAARLAGLAVAQWHKIERGQGGVPRVATRRKIREALGWDRWPDGEEPVRLPAPERDELLAQIADLREVVARLVEEQAKVAKEVRAQRRVLDTRLAHER